MKRRRRSIVQPVRSGLESVRTRIRSIGAEPHPHPVFVLGNQKSGTSPIAGLLARLTGLELTMDIRREIEHPDIERVRRGELAFADFVRRNKLDFSRPIVKEPNLTFVFDALVEAFPDSTVVFVYRDPRDNIRSILNRVNATGRQAELTGEQLRGMTKGWRRVFDGEPVGKKGGHYVETMAYRWDAAARILIDNERRARAVRFEDFLRDKAGEIRRLAQTLRLPDSHDITEHVDFPFQPPGDRSVSWRDFFGPDNLQRIGDICGESMATLGYPPA